MNDAPRTPARPRDAASVVLLRGERDRPQVLMGRRRRRASFLPEVYVFPGGRVESSDRHAPPGLGPRAETARLLRRHGAAPPALALALAGLRETHEETGYLIARPAAAGALEHAPATPFWQALRTAGALPDLERLDFIARALTPVSSPRRFNTRFFLAAGDDLQGAPLADGELEHLHWVALERAFHLPIIDVTRFVLGEAGRRWRGGRGGQHGTPFLRYIRDRLTIGRL